MSLIRSVTFSVLTASAFAGQCTQPMADAWLGNSDFSIKIRDCAIHNLGVASEVAKCLQASYDILSDECANCFGETVQCGKAKCIMECSDDSFAEVCTDCTKSKGCNAQLETCTGFQGPPIPNLSDTNGVSALSGTVALTLGLGILGFF